MLPSISSSSSLSLLHLLLLIAVCLLRYPVVADPHGKYIEEDIILERYTGSLTFPIDPPYKVSLRIGNLGFCHSGPCPGREVAKHKKFLGKAHFLNGGVKTKALESVEKLAAEFISELGSQPESSDVHDDSVIVKRADDGKEKADSSLIDDLPFDWQYLNFFIHFLSVEHSGIDESFVIDQTTVQSWGAETSNSWKLMTSVVLHDASTRKSHIGSSLYLAIDSTLLLCWDEFMSRKRQEDHYDVDTSLAYTTLFEGTAEFEDSRTRDRVFNDIREGLARKQAKEAKAKAEKEEAKVEKKRQSAAERQRKSREKKKQRLLGTSFAESSAAVPELGPSAAAAPSPNDKPDTSANYWACVDYVIQNIPLVDSTKWESVKSAYTDKQTKRLETNRKQSSAWYHHKRKAPRTWQ
ncbi:hypothetical protein F5878DRAFT_237936 [Lentinula raphanica]|uniref:Uncharacterized protein n=1 Tax=Lentinula raphanica TaxID=153919 RepID=A0AA38P603_9AGAR|nr:hypothetical protein F5878DRAFT_237936 [Lentinula raphanica]